MKLHLACGKRYLPGWIHADIRSGPELATQLLADGGQPLPFSADTFQAVYACHWFEHIPRPGVQAVLAEIRRVLQPDGILRLSLPDFRVMAALYLDGVPIEKVLGPVHGRQDVPWNTHYASYDWASLQYALYLAGFGQMRRYKPCDVNPPDYDDYSYAEIDGRLISLNVEARKNGVA